MYVHLALTKKLIGHIASTWGTTIVIQTFVEVPLKPKRTILCNTLIIKKIPYFIVRILR